MARIKTTKRINVTTASFPINILASSNVESLLIHGTKTLSANIAITPSGTFEDGAEIAITYAATITPGAFKLTILGVDFPTVYYSDIVEILAKYINGAWILIIHVDVRSTFVHKQSLHSDVYDDATIENDATDGLRIKALGVAAAHLAASAVITDKINDQAVTLAKMERQAVKTIIVGKGGSADMAAVAGVTGRFLVIGDTDPLFVAITGHVAIDKTGAAVIQSGVITAAMIGAGEITDAEIAAAAAIAFSKMEELTTHDCVLVSSHTGVIAEDSTTQTELQVLHGAVAGTAVAGKAVVLDAGGAIDVLDPTTFKIGGVTVNKSAAQLNGNAQTMQTKSANYNVLSTDDILYADTSGGDVTFYLPDHATATPKTFIFRKTSALNDMIIARSGMDDICDLSLADVTSITITGGNYQTKVAWEVTKWREIT